MVGNPEEGFSHEETQMIEEVRWKCSLKKEINMIASSFILINQFALSNSDVEIYSYSSEIICWLYENSALFENNALYYCFYLIAVLIIGVILMSILQSKVLWRKLVFDCISC